ncbi:MAG: DUF3769 domain-containing protein, partial [Cyanobacteriota bacterium]|nr:DUF3769 domain-containing protein [Cyanobacteriota bacterium]
FTSRITSSILATAQLALIALPAPLRAESDGSPLPAPGVSQAASEQTFPDAVALSADRQIYDHQLGRVVATGRVKATLAGGQLRAERIEYDTTSRTIHAVGSVRFQRGQQFLQASRLRYSLLEGAGELEDVYGVLDVDTSLQDFDIRQSPSQPPSESLPLACPGAARQGASPGMPPPLGCPGRSAPDLEKRTLNEALDAIASGKPTPLDRPESQASPAAPEASETSTEIDQRVDDVRFQGSLKLEGRAGFSGLLGLPEAAAGTPTSFGNVELISGTVSRWRFQARRLWITPGSFRTDQAAFTNDPYTPAQIWLKAENVVATLLPDGETLIEARRNRLILDQRLKIPVVRRYRIRKDEDTVFNRLVPGFDSTDRDGLFVGYRLPTIRLSETIRLDLEPQFMIQRAIEGSTSSYPLAGQPAGSPSSSQPSTAGDLFGLVAKLDAPLLGFQSSANLSISSFAPTNIGVATRSWGEMIRPVTLPLLGDSNLRLFGAYRYRVWNGSLGEQDVYTAYGVSLDDSGALPNLGSFSSSYSWRLGLGNYQANAFNTGSLLALWRGNLVASLNGSLPLWTGEPLPISPQQALIYSPAPIVPGLRINANAIAELAYYGDGTNQNTLTVSAGPALTLGHFSRPFLDYTQLSVTGSISARQGLSELSFDRAVDLGTLSFGLTQQLIGPLLFSGAVGYNIDESSGFFGKVISSYLEVRWQRRGYDIGLYYSPYEGIGGIRIRLNDFNFKGTGTPFATSTPRIGSKRNPF